MSAFSGTKPDYFGEPEPDRPAVEGSTDMTPSRRLRARGRPLASFSDAELEYLLGEKRLGRLATVDADGMPHVVPVGWRYNPEEGTIDVSGHNFAATKKFRNVEANPRAAFVVDDVLPPWKPRSVMVQGNAQAIQASDGGAMIRITPKKVTSWGLDTLSR